MNKFIRKVITTFVLLFCVQFVFAQNTPLNETTQASEVDTQVQSQQHSVAENDPINKGLNKLEANLKSYISEASSNKQINNRLDKFEENLKKYNSGISNSIENLKILNANLQTETSEQIKKTSEQIKGTNSKIWSSILLCIIVLLTTISTIVFVLLIPKQLKQMHEDVKKGSNTKILEKLESDISNIEKKIQSQTSGIVQGVSDAVVEKFRNLENIVSPIRNKFNDISSISVNLNLLDTSIKQLSAKITNVEDKVLLENRKLKEESSTVSSRESKVSAKESSLNARETEIKRREDALESKIKQETDKVEQKRLGEINKLTESFNEKKEALYNDINHLRNEITTLKKEKLELEANNKVELQKEYQKGVDSKNEEIGSLNNKIGSLTEQIKSLEKNTNDRINDVIQKSELKLDIEKEKIRKAFEQQINELKATIQSKDAVLAEKEKIVSQANQDKANAISKCTNMANEIEQLKNTVVQKENAYSQAQAVIANKDNELNKKEEIISSLNDKNEKLEFECNNHKNVIEKLESENTEANETIESLQKSIYPEEFMGDSDFQEPKNHLDSWMKDNLVGFDVVKGALSLLANRELLENENIYIALKDLSLGITTVLKDKDPIQVREELMLWSKFISKYSDNSSCFRIQIPEIKGNYDSNWMESSNDGLIRVNKIKTWAIFHSKYGVQKTAGVE